MLAEWELSMRRAPKRQQVLVMLASLTEATPRALAIAVGIDAQRLNGIMFGDEVGKYSRDLALITLGLAEVVLRGKRRVFVITERGRRKARQLTSRAARKAVAREANRDRRFEPIDASRLGPGVASPAPPRAAGAATGSFAWGFTCGRT